MAVYYDETRKTYYCKFRYTDWTGASRHTSKRGFRTRREDSHVSHLISLGIPITAISARIGHKNPKITLETYSHMYKQDGTGIAGILENQVNVGQSLVRMAEDKGNPL